MENINVNLLVGYLKNNNIQILEEVTTTKEKRAEFQVITVLGNRKDIGTEERRFALHYFISKEKSGGESLSLYVGSQCFAECKEGDEEGRCNLIANLNLDVPFLEEGDYYIGAFLDRSIEAGVVYSSQNMKEKAMELTKNDEKLIAKTEIKVKFLE